MIGVAVVGAGYWGPNLIRNFTACPLTNVIAVCDKDPGRLTKVLAGYPSIDAVDKIETLLERSDVDAVAIATPISSHALIGLAALIAALAVLEPSAARTGRTLTHFLTA